MPKYADIPREFKSRGNKWSDFQAAWFFSGISNLKLTPKEGIDGKVAMRHLAAIQGSWEPKHEHKSAAVAYLASLWFDDIEYTKDKKKR